MGKGKRNRTRRRAEESDFQRRAEEVLTRNFQQQIRNSEFWPRMVAEFGEKGAEELLKECKGELRPGATRNETGHSPEDIQ